MSSLLFRNRNLKIAKVSLITGLYLRNFFLFSFQLLENIIILFLQRWQ